MCFQERKHIDQRCHTSGGEGQTHFVSKIESMELSGIGRPATISQSTWCWLWIQVPLTRRPTVCSWCGKNQTCCELKRSHWYHTSDIKGFSSKSVLAFCVDWTLYVHYLNRIRSKMQSMMKSRVKMSRPNETTCSFLFSGSGCQTNLATMKKKLQKHWTKNVTEEPQPKLDTFWERRERKRTREEREREKEEERERGNTEREEERKWKREVTWPKGSICLISKVPNRTRTPKQSHGSVPAPDGTRTTRLPVLNSLKSNMWPLLSSWSQLSQSTTKSGRLLPCEVLIERQLLSPRRNSGLSNLVRGHSPCIFIYQLGGLHLTRGRSSPLFCASFWLRSGSVLWLVNDKESQDGLQELLLSLNGKLNPFCFQPFIRAKQTTHSLPRSFGWVKVKQRTMVLFCDLW